MYEPPFNRTERIDALCMEIAEMVGALVPASGLSTTPELHRKLRIKTIHSSLAIEGNALTSEQTLAVLNGKTVVGNKKDILEVQNAEHAYALMDELDPLNVEDLLRVHGAMMEGLVAHAGAFRNKNVGVYDGDVLIHAGTPARYVPGLVADLFEWLKSTQLHPLLSSCVFHYEFEFIHPFEDGNGRTGRLWQTLLLSRWRPALAWVPIESVILRRQADYYAAFAAADAAGECGPFVSYLLEVIREALAPYCERHIQAQTRAETLLVYLRDNPQASIPQMAAVLDVSKSTAARVVAELEQAGQLAHEGPRRGGSWVVK